MTTTPVGMRCPECAKQSTKVVRMRSMAKVPRVTYALIVINVLFFVAEGSGAWTISGAAEGSIIRKGALIGSSEAPALAGQGVAHGQWWRIVTSGFLHENLLHIGFNMWVLYYLGLILEPAIGRLRFAAVYAVSLLCGSLGALLVSPHSLTVGASGAIFGLMGAAAVELRARQIPIMQSGVGGLILINLIISFSIPGISWGGHIGGLIGGALAAALLRLADRQRRPALAVIGCIAICVAAVAGSLATSKSSEVEPVGSAPASLLGPEP
jgi:membrane associated rhomboid family serine protease